MNNTASQPINVDIWSDFVSPFCFIAALRLEKLAKQENLAQIWVAFMVRPHDSPPLSEEKRALAERQREEAAATLRSEFDLEMNPGPIDIDTYDAHLVMAHATRTGRGPALAMALMRAYWLEGKSIADRDVIKAIAMDVGLEADEVGYAWADAKNVYHVEQGMVIGVGHGVHSVPTHIFASKYLLEGSATDAELEAVMKDLKEELRKTG